MIMGCYGIGLNRLMGTIVEIFHDEKGIIWPESIAPFKVHLIVLDNEWEKGNQIYQKLLDKGVEVLYDDREGKTAGEKFADADLIGLPIRLVLSAKTLKEKSVELKLRVSKESELVKLTQIDKRF